MDIGLGVWVGRITYLSVFAVKKTVIPLSFPSCIISILLLLLYTEIDNAVERIALHCISHIIITVHINQPTNQIGRIPSHYRK